MSAVLARTETVYLDLCQRMADELLHDIEAEISRGGVGYEYLLAETADLAGVIRVKTAALH